MLAAIITATLMASPPIPARAERPDTTAYANPETRALVERARLRHRQQDDLVRDYTARVHTRADARYGRSRFGRLAPVITHETTARVVWTRPNDLQVEVIGVRSASIFPGARTEVWYGRPWFVPRALGDSVRLMGVPETGAAHPLASGAEHLYRYAIRDSVTLSLPGRTLTAVQVRVEPRRMAPSLVAGDLWLDAETADVVRLSVTFLGEYLWDTPRSDSPRDSANARAGNRRAQRFVTVQADLEYGLHENRYWMPYRQLLVITAEVGLFINAAVPIQALTTFSDYQINTAPVIAFRIPDSALGDRRRTEYRCDTCRAPDRRRMDRRRDGGYERAGLWGDGRWEVVVPPRDSIEAFAWEAPLAFDLSPADQERIRETITALARLSEGLPDEWMGRRRLALGWDRAGDVLRFNRVQGISAGIGYDYRPGPAFTTVRGIARFGTADRRFTGSLAWRYDGPGAEWSVAAYRDLHEAEPWTGGLSLGGSVNALFAGNDHADYHLAMGGALAVTPRRGMLAGAEFRIAGERHRSVETRSGSVMNEWLGGSGAFQPNPAVTEGDFARFGVARPMVWQRVTFEPRFEALVGEAGTAMRASAAALIPFRVAERGHALSLKVAGTLGDGLPQLTPRVGGPETVRGYGYGVRSADAIWAAQLDVALWRSWILTPVVFADAGGAFNEAPLVGLGAGLSFLNGLMRLNLSRGVNPDGPVRFDLLFGAPR